LKLVLNHMFTKIIDFLDKYCINNGLSKLQNGPKNGLCPLGVKNISIVYFIANVNF
jgi:hypothetical protein